MWKVQSRVRTHRGAINAISIHNSDEKYATASADKSVGVYLPDLKETHYLRYHTEAVTDVKFSPKSSLLVSTSLDRQVILWDADKEERVGIYRGHTLGVRCACWSPDGNRIITGSNEKSAVIWSPQDFMRIQNLTGLNGWVRSIKWVGDVIAVAGNDKNILLYDTRVEKSIIKIKTESSSDIISVSLQKDCAMVAAGGFDQYLRVWDMRNHQMIRNSRAHTGIITNVAFSPHNNDVMTTGLDGFVRLWNLKTPDVISSFHNHEKGILGYSWMNNSRGFVTTGEDRLITIVNSIDENENNTNSFDGGDMMSALSRIQNQLENLTNTMKVLDDHLSVQEEKVRWLMDNDRPIRQAFLKTLV